MACGSPGSDLCTRPSSASEASRAANCRHLCSKPPCCRRSRAAVRRSGRSISHSGLRGHSAQRPEPPLHPPPSTRSRLLFPEQPGGCHFLMVHECRPHGPASPEGGWRRWVHCLFPPCSPGEQLNPWATAGTVLTEPGHERAESRQGRRPQAAVGVDRVAPGHRFPAFSDSDPHGPAPAAQNPAPKRGLTGERRARRLGPGAPLRGPVLPPPRSGQSSTSPSSPEPEAGVGTGGSGSGRAGVETGGRARGRVGGPRASVPRTPRTVCHGGTTECFRPPQIFPRPTLTAQARASDTAAAHQGRRCPGTHPSQGSRNSCEWGGLRPGARRNKAAGKRAPAWGASV